MNYIRKYLSNGYTSVILFVCFPVIIITALDIRNYHIVEQGRTFLPGTLIVRKGEVVEIINNDGELLHHAYVKSPTFNFDSGDQEPGDRTQIVFTTPGSFLVLCGIHPKMKLAVKVEDH